jgi:3-methyladenine DNA glycosylase AlkD
MNNENKILKTLYANADAVYRDFNSALIPSISKDSFIGVRTPVLRKIAKETIKSGEYKDFIDNLPHKFFEENQLHAFILSCLRDFNVVIRETERFLPYVDNWATCDQLSPMVFKKHKDALIEHMYKWVKSKHTYTVRFGIKTLMQYWLDDDFDEKYADIVVNIKSDDYYVNMMRAWYFATGLAKQYERILPYLQKLDDWTRKRSIQKALESFRVSDEHKKELRLLK